MEELALHLKVDEGKEVEQKDVQGWVEGEL